MKHPEGLFGTSIYYLVNWWSQELMDVLQSFKVANNVLAMYCKSAFDIWGMLG